MWDAERRYECGGQNITSAYCREVCGGTRCADCPAPRLLPECEPGVAAYLTVATQWRTGGMGGRTGLDYTAVLGTLGTYLPRWQREEGPGGAFEGLEVGDLMESVQIIEMAVLTADDEKRERDKPAGEQ